MKRRATVLACTSLALLSGCLEYDVESTPYSVAVVDEYEQPFHWDEPRPCDIFLHERVTDEESRFVEHHARVGDRELAILYSIADPSEPHPLRVDVYELSGEQRLAITADDVNLVVRDALGDASYEVAEYDEAPPVTGIEAAGRPVNDPDALHLLGCALPLRAELGAVPAFLRNRATGGRLPEDPDVVEDSETSPPILEWNGEVTILGSLLLQAACVRADTWKCPCMSWHDNIAGTVPGWCGDEAVAGDRVFEAPQLPR
jgi:hypothetical protein